MNGLLRRDGLTLALGLGIAYVLLSGVLPALVERHELHARRAAVVRETQALEPRLRSLGAWAEGVDQDPLLRKRLEESWLRSPDAPGYRVVDESAQGPGASTRAR